MQGAVYDAMESVTERLGEDANVDNVQERIHAILIDAAGGDATAEEFERWCEAITEADIRKFSEEMVANGGKGAVVMLRAVLHTATITSMAVGAQLVLNAQKKTTA